MITFAMFEEKINCPAASCATFGIGGLGCGLLWGLRLSLRDPSIQIIPTLGPKVCKYYLHGPIRIPRGGGGSGVGLEVWGLFDWGTRNLDSRILSTLSLL